MSPDSKEILHHSVYRREPLHVAGRHDAPHLALPLTRRLVGDLSTIARVLISDVDYGRHHGAARGGVGTQLVGDQPARDTALDFQQRPKESDGCSPIPVRLHEDVQDVTVLVDRAPQILLATLDRDEHLVEMPGVSHPTAAAPQPPRVDRTEPLAPLPNRRSRVLHYRAWKWANDDVARRKRRCGWPPRTCRGVPRIRSIGA